MAGAQCRGQEKAQRDVCRDVDSYVLKGDIARPWGGEEMQDVVGRHPPAGERLQARVDDDQQIGERKNPGKMDAVRREPGAGRVVSRAPGADRSAHLRVRGTDPVAAPAKFAVSTVIGSGKLIEDEGILPSC